MSDEKKQNVDLCPECGAELGHDGNCYNIYCSNYDPLSQYEPHQIEVSAMIDELAQKHGVTDTDIRVQLGIGTDIELEHTDDRKEAEQIALDHLGETPDYYTRLLKMEKEAKQVTNKLTESQSQEISKIYRDLSKYYDVDLDELVYGSDGFIKTVYPDGYGINADIVYVEELWNEFEEWVKANRGIDFKAIRASKHDDDKSLDE